MCEAVTMSEEAETTANSQTAAEARQRRSKTMITLGAVALIWGFVTTAMGGNPGALVLCLLGVGLLVGGLVIR
jgi:hypothetical protein